MKKTLKIILIVAIVVIIALLGWFWLLPGSSAPVVDKVKDILPFGSGEEINIPVGNEQETPINDEQGVQETSRARLFQISKEPVAGFVAFNKDAMTIIRYADRATGHIYDVNPLTLEKTKITNKTLPKIYEAYFRDNGNAVLFRSLINDGDTVENLSLTLTPQKTTPTMTDNLYTTSAVNLRGDIKEVAVGSGDSLFYVAKDSGSIVSSTFNGTNLRTLFSSSFIDWRLVPYGRNLVIYTKASSDTPGYVYTLSSNGALTKILGPLNGLTVIPNMIGTMVIYSYVENGQQKLFIKDLSNAQILEILPVTLAEKCVWSLKSEVVFICGSPITWVKSNEPDGWYSGATHFSDRVWKFNTTRETAEILIEPEKALGINIDVYAPALSPNEDYLIFVNKNDLSLWAFRLED